MFKDSAIILINYPISSTLTKGDHVRLYCKLDTVYMNQYDYDGIGYRVIDSRNRIWDVRDIDIRILPLEEMSLP